jgi:hypothetical protein
MLVGIEAEYASARGWLASKQHSVDDGNRVSDRAVFAVQAQDER